MRRAADRADERHARAYGSLVRAIRRPSRVASRRPPNPWRGAFVSLCVSVSSVVGSSLDQNPLMYG